MLNLVLVLLLVWFVLSVVLAAWTLLFQGYIYSEPAANIWWGAPAAGTALTVFLVLWVVLDYRAPGRYRELQEFSFTEAEKSYDELLVPNRDGKEEKYLRKKSAQNRWEYLNSATLKPLPSRPDRVIVVEDGQRYTFEPDKDAHGKFKVAPNELLRYRDSRGREMVEGYLGQVSTRHYSWLFGAVEATPQGCAPAWSAQGAVRCHRQVLGVRHPQVRHVGAPELRRPVEDAPWLQAQEARPPGRC